MDSWERFEETKLPSKKAFYSKINLKGISDSDHDLHSKFRIPWRNKPLGCYLVTYLKTDVSLFTDVCETFRNTCSKHWNLYPTHFYAALGLEWQDLPNTGSEFCELSIKIAHYAQTSLGLSCFQIWICRFYLKKICEVGLLKQWNAMLRPAVSKYMKD